MFKKNNTGNSNSGNWNSGDWNSGNSNSGYLNTTEPKARIFNKPTDLSLDDAYKLIPDFFKFDLTEWVREEVMTQKEKDEHPSYNTTGGYLKTLGYKEAWRRAWDSADDGDRRKCLDIPNWDNELFLEISGIDVEKELNKSEEEIEIDGKKYSKSTIKNALREYVK